MTAALTSPSTHTGASTSSERRHESRSSRSCSVRGCAGSPSARTCSRTCCGAAVGSARRSRTSSSNSRSKSTLVADIAHHLLESFQGPAQSRRAGGGADSEHAGHCGAVELEQDTQCHDLAFGGREPGERRFQVAGAKCRLLQFRYATCVLLFAAAAALLGAKVIERRRACDAAEPRARSSPPRIEAPPDTERLLEGLPRQVLCHRPVTGEKQQIAMDRLELGFRDRREGRTVDP